MALGMLKFLKSAKQQEAEELDYISATCKMIGLRRSVEKNIKREKSARHWPIYKILSTPESIITNIVEFHQFLKNDGLTEEESIRRLADFSGQELPPGEGVNLISYIKLRLQAQEPVYLSFGDDLLNRAVSIASACAETAIAKRKSATPFPPASWLQEEIPHDKILAHRNRLYARTLGGKDEVIEAEIPESRDWVRFRLRLKPDDEIRSFSGSLIPGHGLSYRAGIALVRNGVPIEHIVTIKS